MVAVVASALLSFAGIAITLAALWKLNRNLTPFPTPKPGSQLVQTGLYRWVRHPIYTGIILLIFGFAAGVGSVHKLIIAVFLLILFYLKSTYEEKQLLRQYPNYADYGKRTGRFLPNLFKIFR